MLQGLVSRMSSRPLSWRRVVGVLDEAEVLFVGHLILVDPELSHGDGTLLQIEKLGSETRYRFVTILREACQERVHSVKRDTELGVAGLDWDHVRERWTGVR